MAAPEYILVSTVADAARESNLRIKPIADLAAGDYILASSVSDQAKESDLTILPYDSIGVKGAPTHAIGSTVAGDARESDLRVIEMPTSGGWIDITANLSVSTRGSWNGSEFISEQYLTYQMINLYVSSPISETPSSLRVTFSSWTSSQTMTWSWPDWSFAFDADSFTLDNPHEWATAWNRQGMRFRTGWEYPYKISKIEMLV